MSSDLDPVDAFSGDPGGDVLVGLTPEGRAYLVPAVIGALRGEAAELVAEIQGHALAIHREQLALDEVVLLGRAAGLSWNVIGWSVGIDPAGARRRWLADRPEPVRRRAARRMGAPRRGAASAAVIARRAHPEPEWS